MTSRDRRWLEVTQKWRHLADTHLEVAEKAENCVYCTFHFLQGCSSQERSSHMTGNDVTWPQVTGSYIIWPEITSKWLWKAENWRILYISLPTRLELAGGGSHVTANDVTWPQVTGSDPEVTSFYRKSPCSGFRRPKLAYTVHFTSYMAVARRRRQSRDRKWRHVNSGDRKWLGSDVNWPEVAWKQL